MKTASISLLLLLLASGCGSAKKYAVETSGPYADLNRSLGTTEAVPVRGRLVREEFPLDLSRSTPLGEFSQDEIRYPEVEVYLSDASDTPLVHLGTIRGDEEGYFDALAPIDEAIDPGLYLLHVRYEDRTAGTTTARLLPMDHEGLVIRSDVDMTYLRTDFTSASGIMELLTSGAKERRTLPAMAFVYRALRRGITQVANRPLVFLSGSPRFFKRVLEMRMEMDGIYHDGVFLKPFKDIATRNLTAFDLGDISPELREQIGYKLTWLLTGRLELPPTTRELLMGDDTEADFAVYALYHRLTSGAMSGKELMDELERLDVSPGWRLQIGELVPRVVENLTETAPVRGIYINVTGWTNDHHDIDDWLIPDLTRVHRGAWPLILDLYEEGLVDKRSVESVRAYLLSNGYTEGNLRRRAEDAIRRGYLAEETHESFN